GPRGGARKMSEPIDKVALALGIVLLALGPLVLTLLRADSYHSTSYISLNADNPSGRYIENPSKFLSGPVNVRDVQRSIVEGIPWIENARDLPQYLRGTEAGEGRV